MKRRFASFLASLFQPRSRPNSPARRPRGLRLEPLEQRQMLSVCQWTGAAKDGAWFNPSNWSGSQVPTASDDATLATSATITISAKTVAAVNRLDLSGATLDVEGQLTIHGMFQWDDFGVLKGAGQTVAQAGINFDGDSGDMVSLDGQQLTNQGTAALSVQRLRLLDNATFVNQAGALLDIRGAANIDVAGVAAGVGTLRNAGTLRVSAGTGATHIWTTFNNTGVVDVESGQLDLYEGVNNSGTFNVNSPATLEFNTGNGSVAQILQSGSIVSGSGTVIFNSAVMNVNAANYAPANTQIAGGQVNLTGNATLANLDIEGGGYGVLNVNGTLTVSNSFVWDGTLEGTGQTVAQGTTTIGKTYGNDASLKVQGFTNQGTLVFAGNNLRLTAGAVLTNPAGSTFDIQCDGAINNPGGGTAAFNNAGTLRKSAGTQTATIAVPFTNSGAVDIESGTLALPGIPAVNGQESLVVGPLAGVSLSGSVAGNVQSSAQFSLLGKTSLNPGTGTIEAMSQDLGAVPAGFVNNFAYGVLSLSAGAVYTVVDQADNSPGAGPEALYVDALVVPQGTVLNLGGRHVYARTMQIDPKATIAGGSITPVPAGGLLERNQFVAGDIAAAGQTHVWTFTANAGDTVSIFADTGSVSSHPPLSPGLNWAQIDVLNSAGNVLATASNTAAGQDAAIAGLQLSATGTYQVQVSAPPTSKYSTSTGNYLLSVWDSGVTSRPLVLGQQYTSRLASPYDTDSWTFSSATKQQVGFDMLSAAAGNIQFTLTGPNGYSQVLSSSQDLVTLSASGQYAVTVNLTGGQSGVYYSFQLTETQQTVLALGTPYQGTLVATGSAQLFSVAVGRSMPFLVTLAASSTSASSASDHNELYVKLGAPPTRSDYDYCFSQPASANQQIMVPAAAPGTWYILVYGGYVPKSAGYTLTALAAPLVLMKMTPTGLGNGADMLITITGAGFDHTTQVSLVSGNKSYAASNVSVDSFTQVSATFLAGSVPQGTYTVRVARTDGTAANMPGTFQVANGGQAHLETNLILPNALGFHELGTIYVEYSNTGNLAMPAPLLVLNATQNGEPGAIMTLDQSLVSTGFWTSAMPEGFSNSVQILASGAVPGLLEPGETCRAPVYWAGWQKPWDAGTPFEFQLGTLDTTNATPIDWSQFNQSPPAGVSQQAWKALWQNVATLVGGKGTWGNWLQAIDQNAAYLGRLGENVDDAGQLFAFEAMQADGLSPLTDLASADDVSVPAPGMSIDFQRTFQGTSLLGRNTLGPLGYGWTDNWQYSLSTDPSDGTVTVVMPDGERRIFQLSNGQSGNYISQPGDQGTPLLSADGKTYSLREGDGTLFVFSAADGSLQSVADPNGDCITLQYTAGRLTKLSDASGQQWLQIGYNYAGQIASVTNPVGRQTLFTYDADQQLIAVKNDGLTTTYTYYTGTSSALAHTLTSITSPGNVHEYFAYDSLGRLTRISDDVPAESLGFSYNSAGGVTATDATGAATNYDFDYRGLIAKVQDPLDRSVQLSYNSANELTQVTDGSGDSYSAQYDANGNLTGYTDPLGHQVQFSYQTLGTAASGNFYRLASYTDPDGNKETYTYNAQGDLLTTSDADGQTESLAYQGGVDPTSSTNCRGQQIAYTYDTAGRILSETFPDGSQVTYSYDTRGNLTKTTDATGATTYHYDTDDYLVEIDYPGGQFLKFTYDAAGRRASMTDQAGHVTNYSYDAAGRLHLLTDGSNRLIDLYQYNADGQLSQETKGNGTSTTYQYNTAGQVIHLVNYDPKGNVLSRFDYSYGASGLCSGMTTLDGQWTYGYDADGELTTATFQSKNPATVPNQSLTYKYDAAGNRVSVTQNGVTTPYATNNLNQYTSVGTASYYYDADGNLVCQQDGADSATYTYDAENRLIQAVNSQGTWDYQYDALGHLAAVIHNGQKTTFNVDPTSQLGSVVGEYGANGALVADYVQDLGLVSSVDASGNATYYDYDALGSTADTTNASGAVTNSYNYDPFGNILSQTQTTANPFTFVVQFGVMQDGSGLDSMGARFYSASLGRFTSTDPTGLLGGDTNLYRYVRNSPTGLIDPHGLQAAEVLDGASAVVGTEGAAPLAEGPITDANAQLWAQDGAVLGISPEDWQNHFGEMNAAVANAISNLWYQATEIPVDVGNDIYNWFQSTYVCALGYDMYYDAKFFVQDQWTALQTGISNLVQSHDPNDLIGPAGFGPSGFVAANQSMPYQINFENDPTATAPVQNVQISDFLDKNLDWNTFDLTEIGFGSYRIAVPTNSQYYEGVVDMTVDGQTIEVQVEAGIRADTGEVYATFQAIDPKTGLPPDVTVGFLPPEDGTGRGDGFVSFVVRQKPNLPTGTQIRNVAGVTFDFGATVMTDQIDPEDPSKGIDPTKQCLNTIDAGPPTSRVAPLPAQSFGTAVIVSWSGQDENGAGSGIATYDVYVSDNGAAFQPWLTAATATSATYTGQIGHTYAFYCVATDNAGNRESKAAAAEATTTLVPLTATTVLLSSDHASGSTYGQTVTLTATVQAVSGTVKPTGLVQLIVDGAAFGAPAVLSNGMATFSLGTLSLGDHAIIATYIGSSFQNSQATLKIHVAPATTSVSLSSSASSAIYAQPVTLTATVLVGVSGAGAAGGSVTFFDGGAPLATVALDANGTATLSLPALGLGSHALTADYSGDAHHATSASAASVEQVQSAVLEPDPLAPGQQALFVGGTAGNDVIKISPSAHAGQLTVAIQGQGVSFSGEFTNQVSRIAVYGGAGDDRITVARAVKNNAWLFGGDGNDTLTAGGGPTLLVGGDGNDRLKGGIGRDVFIGGDGADALSGSGKGSILIGGTTAYDANDAALAAILAEWSSSASYQLRVQHLLGTTPGGLNGQYLLNASTVFDDDKTDRLTGGPGLDWFFARIGGSTQGRDKVIGQASKETLTPVSKLPPTLLDDSDPDPPAAGTQLEFEGTVVQVGQDGGFYGIVGDDGTNYDPLNLPDDFAQQGERVQVTVETCPDSAGANAWGTQVELLDIQPGSPPAPAAPTNLTASVAAQSVDLSWTDNSNNETGFRIAVSQDGGATWSNCGTVAANVTSFNVTGLKPGTRYLFKVRAANGTLYSDYSNIVDLHTKK